MRVAKSLNLDEMNQLEWLADDGVHWLKATRAEATLFYFITAPYLYAQSGEVHGKLIFISEPPYEVTRVIRVRSFQKLYKTAYRRIGSLTEMVNDAEIQRIANKYGAASGTGVDRMLNYLGDYGNAALECPRMLMECYDNIEGRQLADEIGCAYGVDPERIGLTGGLQLFGGSLKAAHDVDVIVPVESTSHAQAILNQSNAAGRLGIEEYGIRWPLRWRSSSGTIVCPFFLYDSFQPPMRGFSKTAEYRLVGSATILNEAQGIFNLAFYQTKGAVENLAIRTTFTRGMIRTGQSLQLNCPAYRVTEGQLMGCEVALITDPWTEIQNFAEMISHAAQS